MSPVMKRATEETSGFPTLAHASRRRLLAAGNSHGVVGMVVASRLPPLSRTAAGTVTAPSAQAVAVAAAASVVTVTATHRPADDRQASYAPDQCWWRARAAGTVALRWSRPPP